jgi:gliding motility-associated-like protein
MFAVKVTDEYNCSAMQYRMVKVIESCGDDIFIPNAFTPNGDEMNDKLCIRSLEMQAIKIFRIFNRWGELVFETTDINHCWDGYFKGKIVNPDVYVYYAEGICTAGQAKLIKGNVTVVR